MKIFLLFTCSVESKLEASDSGIINIKVCLANSTPEIVMAKLKSTSVISCTISQSNASLSASC